MCVYARVTACVRACMCAAGEQHVRGMLECIHGECACMHHACARACVCVHVCVYVCVCVPVCAHTHACVM